MEVQLQELIEQIKKDGVSAAEEEAKAIIEKANSDADSIIANAKAEAEKIIAESKAENERLVRVSEDAIKQAGRNLLISFRESVNCELNHIINENVRSAFSPEKLTEIITRAVDSWVKNEKADDLCVILNKDDLKSLEENLLSALKEKMLTGITLKPSDSIDKGFRIAVDGGKAYYDFSAEAVTEMLSAYLNPKVTALMKEAENK